MAVNLLSAQIYLTVLKYLSQMYLIVTNILHFTQWNVLPDAQVYFAMHKSISKIVLQSINTYNKQIIQKYKHFTQTTNVLHIIQRHFDMLDFDEKPQPVMQRLQKV